MAGSSRIGHIQFGIEVKLRSEQTSLAAHRQLLATCQQLHGLFRRYDVQPTWALDESIRDAVQNALGNQPNYALLASTDEALSQYIKQAKPSPHRQPLTTLFSRVDPTLLQLAELAAVGVRAIGLRLGHDPRAARLQYRHGVCLVRSGGQLPGYGSLLGRWDGAFEAKQLMHRALRRESTELITIPVDQLQDVKKSIRLLEKTLVVARRLVTAGRIACESLLQTRDRLCPSSPSAGAHSILRAA